MIGKKATKGFQEINDHTLTKNGGTVELSKKRFLKEI